MRHLFISAVVFLSGISGDVFAQCPGTLISSLSDLRTELVGNTVCVGSPGAWEAQEYHAGGPNGGDLIDYKQGPAAPGNIDPTSRVGSWAVGNAGGNALVIYTYDVFGPAESYTNSVYVNGASYCFDNGTTETTAFIKSGQVSCE